MSSGFINARDAQQQAKTETSLIKCKLRMTLLIRTTSVSQDTRAKAFRRKEKNANVFMNDLAQEISGCTVTFEDKDDNGDYLIVDEIFIADECSPRALENMSVSIDSYIRGFCISNDVEKVIPCFFIPSVSCTPIISTQKVH